MLIATIVTNNEVAIGSTDNDACILLARNALMTWVVADTFNRKTGERKPLPTCFSPSVDCLALADAALVAYEQHGTESITAPSPA